MRLTAVTGEGMQKQQVNATFQNWCGDEAEDKETYETNETETQTR